MKKLTPEQLQERRRQEQAQLEFERKIEEDRLGISRLKQRRVMRFSTYRIIKLVLLGLIAVSLFIYTPALLPLCVVNAFMILATRGIQREKNKHVNKKYRVKIKATDSIIAILLILLTVGVTGYNLTMAYMNDGSLNNSIKIEERLDDAGFDKAQISAAVRRRTGENSYERIAEDAMSMLSGNRNVFQQRRRFFRGTPPNIDSADMPAMRSRPNVFQMLRRMPLEMLMRQIFQLVCAVMVGIMVLVGVVNVIESFKYGEIKKPTLSKKFQTRTGVNDPCPCGSGKKIKNCSCRTIH